MPTEENWLPPEDTAGSWTDVVPGSDPSAQESDAYASYLHDLVGGGETSIIELGAGSGRIAVRLARLGAKVTAVEYDPEMLAVLRTAGNPYGLSAVDADMTEYVSPEPHNAVLLIQNILYTFMTQSEQLAFLDHSARQIHAENGILVVENFLPNPGLMRPRRQVIPRPFVSEGTALQVTEVDWAQQTITMRDLIVAPDSQVRHQELRMRYIWPSELLLMARLAGLELLSLHGGFNREPLTPSSAKYIAAFRLRG